jgi:DNA-binding transcriptional MerR regulator
MFRRKDVELLLRIKHLLYDQKFTIEGARKSLSTESKAPKKPVAVQSQVPLFNPANGIPEIRREVVEIIKLLS